MPDRDISKKGIKVQLDFPDLSIQDVVDCLESLLILSISQDVKHIKKTLQTGTKLGADTLSGWYDDSIDDYLPGNTPVEIAFNVMQEILSSLTD